MDKVNSILLRWWFLLCTQVALGTVAYHFNFFHHLYREDITRIGFIILGILILTTLWLGKKVYSLKTKWAGNARDYGNGNRTYRDESNDDYLVNDLSIRYNLMDTYNLFFNINNILDENYETARDYSQMDRSFNFGIRRSY